MPGRRGAGWAALFLRADSPGMVFRHLQRRWGRSQEERARLDALGLLLSDAAPPEGWRALVGGPDATPWMRDAGAALVAAFPPGVVLLFADAEDSAWGYRVWAAGSDPESGGETVSPPRRGVLSRLTGRGAPSTAARAASWAGARSLPLDRVPGAARRPPPICDYSTVAGLDERSLLVEDGPRLYRFGFGGGGPATV